MMKINISAALLIILIILLTGCKKDSVEPIRTEIKDSTVPVTITTATLGDFHVYGEYYGRTKGINRASIINISGGTVESVAIVEGAFVSKGDSLAMISSRSAEITLESAILNEKISRDNYETLNRFLKSGNSTPLNVDQAHLTWLNSQSQLINAQKNYDSSFCISPIDGVVVSRNINNEDEVFQGQTTFLIEDLNILEIEIGIPESDMEGIHEGSMAEITIDLYPGKSWPGELTRFSRRSSDENLTFAATVIVDNRDGEILSGTTAKVKLLRKSYINQIILPTDAVVNDGDIDYVMVLNNDIVTKREVIVAASNTNECVVLDGINAGDVVIEDGLQLLVDSQSVRVIR